MSIIQRFARMVKAYLNHWIGKVEDPERMLEQMLSDMQQQLIDSQRQVAIAISDEKKLMSQYEEAKKEADSWEKKAIMAVKSSRDDLAQQAIEKQAESIKQVNILNNQLQAQQKAVENLRISLNTLNNQINESKRNKNLLIARSKRAQAQRDISATLSGLSKINTLDTMYKIEEKISRIEAEAQATTDMVKELEGAKLNNQFKELESIEKKDSLAELKNKIKNNNIENFNDISIKEIEDEIKYKK